MTTMSTIPNSHSVTNTLRNVIFDALDTSLSSQVRVIYTPKERNSLLKIVSQVHREFIVDSEKGQEFLENEDTTQFMKFKKALKLLVCVATNLLKNIDATAWKEASVKDPEQIGSNLTLVIEEIDKFADSLDAIKLAISPALFGNTDH